MIKYLSECSHELRCYSLQGCQLLQSYSAQSIPAMLECPESSPAMSFGFQTKQQFPAEQPAVSKHEVDTPGSECDPERACNFIVTLTYLHHKLVPPRVKHF